VSARAEFLASLRAGLRGVPARELDDVIADYTAHFNEGAVTGRSEENIATALGDPLALADELRAELRIERWQASPSVRSGLHVIAAATTLGLINAALLLVAVPLMLLFALTVIIGIAAFAGGGIWMLIAGASLHLPGGVYVFLLSGLGLIAAAIALIALAVLAARLLVDAVGRYIRLHRQFLSRGPRAGLPT